VQAIHRCIQHDDQNFEARTPEDMPRLKNTMKYH